jgi:hypothetical protein
MEKFELHNQPLLPTLPTSTSTPYLLFTFAHLTPREQAPQPRNAMARAEECVGSLLASSSDTRKLP